MKNLKLLLCAGGASVGLMYAGTALADDQASGSAPASAPAAAPAAPAAPAANPMPYPSMTAPLSANPNPAVFDSGPVFGKVMVDGVVSGLALYQTSPQVDGFGDQTKRGIADLSNAQVIINKTDGVVQFYLQAGAYSVPVVGEPYYKTSNGAYDANTYGYVPQAFIKLVPNSTFSVEVGALPTLIGDEYTFTFENMNIERGLLWNQEPVVSKGIQGNFTKGPWAVSVAVTDGYYSGQYTAISGLVTYTFKNSDTLAFAAEGNAATAKANTFVTPAQQNNGQVYNLIYTHSQGPWTFSPYIQYTNSPNIPGVSASGETWGGALLVKYSFTPQWALAGRAEYISSSGASNLLGYGVGSDAWSVTLTPTYQKGIFFARGEFSYVGVGGGTKGLMFGSLGDASNQTRAMFETGLIF
jgi:hypothetical protein